MLSSKNLRPEEQLLVWSIARLSDGPPPELCPARPTGRLDWKVVLSLATWHRLLPLLYHQAKHLEDFPEVPHQVLEYLGQVSQWNLTKNLVLRAHLQEVLLALEHRQIPALVLKGIPLEERLYPRFGTRPTSDIDVMVRRSDLPGAQEVLESLGYESSGDEPLREAFRQYHHHLAPFMHARTGTTVELHWHIVSPASPLRMNVDEMWDRAQPNAVGGASSLMLAPEDQLLHLCLHFLNDRLASRPASLLQLCDIALLLRRDGGSVRWGDFVERTLAHSVGPAVYTALYAAKLVAGSVLPPEASRLRPGGFDEEQARLFVIRRIVGVSDEVSADLVRTLAVRGIRGKARVLRHIVRPPAEWTPGGDLRVALTSAPAGLRYLFRPFAGLAVIARAIFHLPRLRDQVRVEQWLAQYPDMAGSDVEMHPGLH